MFLDDDLQLPTMSRCIEIEDNNTPDLDLGKITHPDMDSRIHLIYIGVKKSTILIDPGGSFPKDKLVWGCA